MLTSYEILLLKNSNPEDLLVKILTKGFSVNVFVSRDGDSLDLHH